MKSIDQLKNNSLANSQTVPLGVSLWNIPRNLCQSVLEILLSWLKISRRSQGRKIKKNSKQDCETSTFLVKF